MKEILSFRPYFLIFAFFISALSAFAIMRLGPKLFLIDTPNERSSHMLSTPRGGGIGIWLCLIIVALLLRYSTQFIVIIGIIGLIGLIEDRYGLSSKARLISQLFLSAAVLIFYSKITLINVNFSISVSLLLFLFWVVFITATTNFYNFMDGINGISGLTGIIVFGLLALFSLLIVKDLYIFSISTVLVFACFGFLPFNFPKAKVFMGDVGSLFLGFTFAAFVSKLSINFSAFLCLVMFLGLFYADSIITIFYRWRKREKLTKAHRNHLYQYLSNELMLPHWIVAIAYALVQLIVGLLSIWAYQKNITWQIILFGLYAIAFIIAYRFIKLIKPKYHFRNRKSLV